jgi:hypothetical protein
VLIIVWSQMPEKIEIQLRFAGKTKETLATCEIGKFRFYAMNVEGFANFFSEKDGGYSIPQSRTATRS